jgi:hypothetical protein
MVAMRNDYLMKKYDRNKDGASAKMDAARP